MRLAAAGSHAVGADTSARAACGSRPKEQLGRPVVEPRKPTTGRARSTPVTPTSIWITSGNRRLHEHGTSRFGFRNRSVHLMPEYADLSEVKNLGSRTAIGGGAAAVYGQIPRRPSARHHQGLSGGGEASITASPPPHRRARIHGVWHTVAVALSPRAEAAPCSARNSKGTGLIRMPAQSFKSLPSKPVRIAGMRRSCSTAPPPAMKIVGAIDIRRGRRGRKATRKSRIVEWEQALQQTGSLGSSSRARGSYAGFGERSQVSCHPERKERAVPTTLAVSGVGTSPFR